MKKQHPGRRTPSRSGTTQSAQRIFRIVWALALAASWVANPAPSRAAKVDLGPYLGPAPSVGDYRLYDLSTGGSRLQEILEVSQWKKGFRVTSQQEETGSEAAFAEIFVVPGKKTLIGDGAAAGLFIDVKKPKTFLRVRAKLGKTYRVRAKATAFFDQQLVGKAKYKGAWALSGFEPLETPVASYPDTAVAHAVLELIIQDRVFGDVIESVVERTTWLAPGLGDVASRQRTTAWVNGAMVDDTGWVEAWLVDGRIGGQLLP